MAKRGSITVFLTLLLSLLLSLVCTSVESVRMAAARNQILNGLDIGLYSLFGQYDRTLLEQYDLFFLDGSCGGGSLKLAQVYDNMEKYIKPVLKENSQKLSFVRGGFTGYRLAADENGEVFYHQVVRYMKDTLGSRGVQLLLEKMRGREEKTREAETSGSSAERGDALGSYEKEMNAADKNSQEAAAELTEEGVESAEENEDFSDGEEVENPIPIIKQIRRMGILGLVLPGGAAISDGAVSKASLVSGRSLQTGMDSIPAMEKDNTYSSKLLFQQYLMEKLGNYRKTPAKGLRYQIEYVIQGESTDAENLKSVANKLLLIREGVNMAHLLSDPVKRGQVEALALGIASGFLVPPAAVIIEGAVLLCWAFAESILDVRELFDGGKIPLVKSAQDWQLSLKNLPYLLDGLDSARKNCADGMSYEDYLQVLLAMQGKEKLLMRGMDMVELKIRQLEGRGDFRLDSCIEAVEAAVEVRANRRKTFTAVKQYCYD